ncbi:PaaI family thioesterase [Anaerobacillus alkaliphilus]|nr:PaaI family thioesterase [Anaerobacillus alkaliphilus]
MTKKNKLLDEIEQYLTMASSENREILETLFRNIKEKHNGKHRSYLSALMQVKGTVLENGNYEIRIPIQPLIHNPLGMVHGGIIASVIDISMGSIVHRSIPDGYATVTTELKINYLKPGLGKELICVASILHKGNSLCVCEARVYNDEESLVAIGTGSFFVLKPRTS